jgi:phytoene desaturase
MHTSEPREGRYDVVVVGSGFGGLSAGAFLARAGKSVLVVERLDGPGGYAHAFEREGYVFDPAVHAVGESGEGGMIDLWLRALGVRDECTFLPLGPSLYTAVYPDFQDNAPFGIEDFIGMHAAHFPDEERGLRDFMDVCEQLRIEWDRMGSLGSLSELEQAAESFPTTFRYRHATVQQVMDDYLRDQRLKALLTALWGYCGVPPSSLSFADFGGMLTALLEGGQSYCQGSFQNLVNAWVTGLERGGGELVLQNQVTGIGVKDGRVSGVTLADGREIRADLVVSNADATQTFEELVGLEHLPSSYARRLQRMTLSISAFVLYTATTLDLDQFDYAHEIFVLTSWDHDETWANTLGGTPSAFAITAPTVVDPSLAPEGEHIVTTVAFAPYDLGIPWEDARERWTELILEQVERLFPGIGEKLLFVESATPLALEKYSLNRNGAMYGWENTPRQAHSKRPTNATPVEGLYLSSAWAQPGSGTLHAMRSGFQTAQAILGYRDSDEFLEAVRSGAAV